MGIGNIENGKGGFENGKGKGVLENGKEKMGKGKGNHLYNLSPEVTFCNPTF